MIASRYSVSQSSSEAGFTRASIRCTASSPRTSQPESISISTSGLRLAFALARSTSRVSAAPQTPVRRILALSTMDFAIQSAQEKPDRSAVAGRHQRDRGLGQTGLAQALHQAGMDRAAGAETV